MSAPNVQDWRTLPAGRALDDLIEERVFGPWRERLIGGNAVPRYSTDVGCAWRVINVLHGQGWNYRIGRRRDRDPEVRCALALPARLGFPPHICIGTGATAALAICRAALAAVEAA